MVDECFHGGEGSEDFGSVEGLDLQISPLESSESDGDELFDDVLQCLLPRKKRIRDRRRIPFKVPRFDVRRQFCTMFANVMNMQDNCMTQRFFTTFCTPDMKFKIICGLMDKDKSGEKQERRGFPLQVQSQSAVSTFFSYLQYFAHDLVVTMDNIEVVTRLNSEDVTVRALMSINNTIMYQTPLPLLAHNYLLASSSREDTEPHCRKRKHESSALSILPLPATVKEAVRLRMVVNLLFNVDKEKRITSIDFSQPIQTLIEPCNLHN